MKKLFHFCTCITSSHLCYALGLSRSLGQNACLHVVLTDNSSISIKDIHIKYTLNIEFYSIKDVCLNEVGRKIYKKYYNKNMDIFRWAMKSVILLYFLESKKIPYIIWVDCDIYFLGDWTFLFELLNNTGILLTPHWKPYHDISDSKKIPYYEHFQYGLFNAGFVGASQKGIHILRWWAEACFRICTININYGYYGDQSHLNLFPVYFDNVTILKHKGCNIAHWNIEECPRKLYKKSIMIDNIYPLIFVHFAIPYPDIILNGFDSVMLEPFLQYVINLWQYGLSNNAFICRDIENIFILDILKFALVSKRSFIIITDIPSIIKKKLSKFTLPLFYSFIQPNTYLKDKRDNNIAILCDKIFKSSLLQCCRSNNSKIICAYWKKKEDPIYPQNECIKKFEELIKNLRIHGYKKFFLFGAGKHTYKILSKPIGIQNCNIKGIIEESDTLIGKFLFALPIIPPSQVKVSCDTAIIISSDAYQTRLFDRAKLFFPEANIFVLYSIQKTKVPVVYRKYDKVLPGFQLIKLFWKHLAKLYPKNGSKKILLWGCGKFFRILTQCYLSEKNNPNILGVYDDYPDNIHKEYFFPSIPLLTSFSEIDFCSVDAIIPTTDYYESEIIKQIRWKLGNTIKVITFSEFQKNKRIRTVGHIFQGNLHFPTQLSIRRRIEYMEALTVCVGYGDILEKSLPFNIRHFDQYVVVTSPEDIETINICKKYGAKVVVSKSYKIPGGFCKAKMLNVGFKFLCKKDWILLTDADIILPPDFRDFLNKKELYQDALYIANRINAPVDDDWLNEFHQDPTLLLDYDAADFESSPVGYFQLFHRDCKFIKNRNSKILFPEKFLSAGGVDYYFQALWPEEYKINSYIQVIHIQHGDIAESWVGRKFKSLFKKTYKSWQPVGYLFQTPFYKQFHPIPKEGYIRITRSDTAECIISERANFLLYYNSKEFLVGIKKLEANDLIAGISKKQNSLNFLWNGQMINPTDFEIAWSIVRNR